MTQRVLERLDAELSEKGDGGRPVLAGKVAIVSVVGNEAATTAAARNAAHLARALKAAQYPPYE